MSIVLACAFPEAAIILCDSRVSDGSSTRRSDILRKTYGLSPLLAVGFASNDVVVTEKIIAAMTDYVENYAESKNTRYLLSKLPKVAAYYYQKFCASKKEKSRMEFIFAGIDPTVSAIVSGKKLLEMFKRALAFRSGGSGSVSSRFLWGMERQKGDAMPLPPPAAIVGKLVFPGNIYEDAAGLGYAVAGSDIKAAEKLQRAFEQAIIVGSDSEVIRQAMIASIIEDHRKQRQVDTIGGLTQTLLISEKGISALGYSYTAINRDGSKGDSISMRFENGYWVQERSRDGKQIKVSKLPAKIGWNVKFEAGLLDKI